MCFDIEELCNFHSLPNIVRTLKSSTMNSTGHVKWMGGVIFTCRVLVETPESKKPLGRPRYGCKILT
jgi:hypothetical protein